jgi:hypothetical protein
MAKPATEIIEHTKKSERLNPDFPIKPSFPRRRESSKKNSPRSGQSTKVDLLRRRFSMNWIPAFAGMTAFFMDYSD